MRRRDFSLGAAALATLGVPGLASAQMKAPQDGIEYVTLNKRAPVEAPQGKIEVIEFFWYSCPHCNAFEPLLQDWIKRLPSHVSLRRVPVAFRDSMVPQQRLFYTLEAMGKVDALHGKVFDAIHKEQLDLTREQGILEWVAKQGLDAQKFQELYRSFAVSSKARRAVEVQDMYQVDGVPALGIAGRWYTDGSLAGNMTRALQVTDHLIAQARQA
ncbi:thiol:disulfide interchange protein DsbA [Ramlibacter solisilvae]|uniref:Thiol:disulfide interchange protein n=1 Tax=Ramlibacter tataouinensis TaxID=94132 RepID=A0A127JZ50_9BURK|nr:thiol:disulfide interchange protein DsbA/DsbL [Ramlibacter tataouinensis]AMO23392.1 DSBA oxidoreductase [Ramlibacter tataouinensis]